MRNIFSFILVVLLAVAINAQTVSLNTYGVSPRDVEADTNDIFDLAFNGLLNVGTETQMYLKGSSSLALSGGATWTLTTRPDGSTAILGTPTVADTSTEFLIFNPDVAGTFVITFESSGVPASITINAGLYLGDSNSPSCATCHAGVGTEYLSTNHAVATQKQFDAMEGGSSHFASYCLDCHATGYDTNALNDGFDDFTFVFPDTFATGIYDSMKTAYPDAMARANVQCEACHGVGSEHNGNTADNKMLKSLDSKTCAICHDSGTHHFEPLQWDNSGHANPPSYPGGGRNSCRGCHDGAQFIQYVNGETITSMDVSTPITCATCHDPHNAENEHQVRTITATLSNDEVVTDGGTGKLCMNCHQSRREANSYTETGSGSHYGPHYVPQADMLNGTNAVTFGFELPTSPHLQSVENSCVGCHMSSGSIVDGAYPTAGGHSFAVVDEDGNHKVDICTDCHGDVGATFDEKKYFFNGDADHDGDGAAEGLTEEVEGMMEELASLLPHADSVDGYDPHDTVTDDTFTKVEKKAAFNYELVYYDHSHGIHNPAYTVALLKVSIEALKYGTITSGAIVNIDDILNDQGYQVRVVWTAFGADDGIAADQVESYTILRQAPVGGNIENPQTYTSFKGITNDLVDGALISVNGELWDVVATVPAIRYLEYSAVVPTLHNAVEGDTVLSTFKVLGKTANGIQAETDPMSGSSWDNLVPTIPAGIVAELDGENVALIWDDPVDKDFNYFSIYRSETQGFIPAEENVLATTIESIYNDLEVEVGKTYFYQITAWDFSKNQSNASTEVNVSITDVGDMENIPTEYSLNQNYPNPFNPSTTIKFGIPETTNVQLIIYDMVGNKVAELVNNSLSSGYYTFNWDASNHASGIYFCQMTTNKYTSVNKMLLIK